MKIRTIGLLAIMAAFAAACGPQPGSAEWCKAAMEGKIQPSEAETQAHGPACAQQLMQDMMKSLQAPSQ